MKVLHPYIWLALSAAITASACSSDSDDVGAGANAVGGSKPTPAGAAGTGSASSTSSNGFQVTFLGSQAHADGTSTWRYRVDELPCAQDLSNWVLEVFDCTVVGASPEPNEFVHPDPNAKLTGVKWETGGGFSSGEFAVTVSGPAREAAIRFGVKGPGVELGETTGPRCSDAARPPVGDVSKGSGPPKRCPDASVPPPPPPPTDGGCPTISCDESTLCPIHHFCESGCCTPVR